MAFNILPRVQRPDGGIISPLQFFRWLSPPSDLLHERKEIADTPMVGDFAVLDTHDIDRLEMDFTVSWSDAKKGSFVSAVVRLVRCHSVTIGKLPVDVRMKVGECGTNIRVEFSYACLVWSSVRLRRVIDEIVGEEFVEHVKSSLPWTSSVFRRTTAFAASEEFTLLIFFTLLSWEVYPHTVFLPCVPHRYLCSTQLGPLRI